MGAYCSNAISFRPLKFRTISFWSFDSANWCEINIKRSHSPVKRTKRTTTTRAHTHKHQKLPETATASYVFWSFHAILKSFITCSHITHNSSETRQFANCFSTETERSILGEPTFKGTKTTTTTAFTQRRWETRNVRQVNNKSMWWASLNWLLMPRTRKKNGNAICWLRWA